MNKEQMNSTLIYALGGLNEVGKNCYCFQKNDEIIVVDAGQKFTPRSNLGADAIIPDYKYLKNNEKKIAGIFITHGHEDHIGALPFLLQKLKIKRIYVTRISKSLIINKLKYANIPFNAKIFHTVKIGKKIKTKNFTIIPFLVNHSIPEALGYHIETLDGKIIFTGDFKFDQMYPGKRASYELLTKWGQQGVNLLMSDSTNAQVKGYSKSEYEIGSQIQNLIQNSQNRMIFSCFSSNMFRVRQIIESARKVKRKICIVGKSMENAIEILAAFKYLDLKNDFIEAKQLKDFNDNEILILCTGSQGEKLAGLNRIASNRIKDITIKKNDQIVFSSSPIPGNKLYIDYLMNQFVKLGAKIIDSSIFESIHASGHGYKLEQQLMINLVKPKYFFPIHGTVSMLKQHQLNAIETGIDMKNTFICFNGEVLILNNQVVTKTGMTLEIKNYYVENKTNHILDDGVHDENDNMGRNGVLLIYSLVNSKNGKFTIPRICYFGFANEGNNSSKEAFKAELTKKLNSKNFSKYVLDKLNSQIISQAKVLLYKQKRIRPLIIAQTIIQS